MSLSLSDDVSGGGSVEVPGNAIVGSTNPTEHSPPPHALAKEPTIEDSHLYQHAKYELGLIEAQCDASDPSVLEMQKQVTADLLEVVTVFARQGHSGFSAGYSISLLTKLLRYEPITPLTGEYSEWVVLDLNHSISVHKRCGRVVKYADGKVMDNEGYVFHYWSWDDNKYTTGFTNWCSRKPVTFPYVPCEPKHLYAKKQYTEKDIDAAMVLDTPDVYLAMFVEESEGEAAQ